MAFLAWAKAIPSATDTTGRTRTSLRRRYPDQVRRVSSQPGSVDSRHPVSLPIKVAHGRGLGPPGCSGPTRTRSGRRALSPAGAGMSAYGVRRKSLLFLATVAGTGHLQPQWASANHGTRPVMRTSTFTRYHNRKRSESARNGPPNTTIRSGSSGRRRLRITVMCAAKRNEPASVGSVWPKPWSRTDIKQWEPTEPWETRFDPPCPRVYVSLGRGLPPSKRSPIGTNISKPYTIQKRQRSSMNIKICQNRIN